MHFDLRTPCKTCPFVSGRFYGLQPERVREILEGILDQGMTFTCHNAVHGETIEDEDGHETGYKPGLKDQHCAGALILIVKTKTVHRMTAIAKALKIYDPTTLDLEAPVFASAEAMQAHYDAQNYER